MSVYRQKTSKYYQIRFTYNGKLYCKSSRTSNKRLAQQLEVKWLDEIIKQKELGEGKDITLREALKLYVSTKKHMRTHCNYKMFETYMNTNHDTDKDLTVVTTAKVNEWVHKRKGSQATKKHFVNMLRGTIKEARAHGYKVNQIDFPKIKTTAGRIRFLTDDEERALLRELQPTSKLFSEEQQTNYDFVVFLMDVGCRYGEACNIKWRDIDLNKKTIHLYRPKVNNASVLFMTDRLHKLLVSRYKRHPNETYVFAAKDGGPRKYSTIAIRKAFKRAGLINFRVHDLRHHAASKLAKAGLSVQEIGFVLGHANVATSMRYIHLTQDHVATKARDALNTLNTTPRPNIKITK